MFAARTIDDMPRRAMRLCGHVHKLFHKMTYLIKLLIGLKEARDRLQVITMPRQALVDLLPQFINMAGLGSWPIIDDIGRNSSKVWIVLSAMTRRAARLFNKLMCVVLPDVGRR